MVGLVLTQLVWKTQTNWMGGPGVSGPVEDWETQFWQGDSITAATEGQVSLVATQWDYTAWVKHNLDGTSYTYPEGPQGLMSSDVFGKAVDINNDGYIDVVGWSNDSAVWYESLGSYNFAKHPICYVPAGGSWKFPCVYPSDVDNDGDWDVLWASNVSGLGWAENLGGNWIAHVIDESIGFHRVSAADFDKDGDIDILAVDDYYHEAGGDIYVFWNDGSQNFTKQLLYHHPSPYGAWRVYPFMANKDEHPDVYAGINGTTWVFIYDTITNSFNGLALSSGGDGVWPSDINMDGAVDIVHAGDSCFRAQLVDGYGNFNGPVDLIGTGGYYDYGDGAIARDIDLDGLPDIVGANRYIGWFKQRRDSLLIYRV